MTTEPLADARPRVLVVEPGDGGAALRDVLARTGYDVIDAANADAAAAAIATLDVDAVLVDIDRGSDAATTVLRAAQRKQPGVPVVIVSEHARIDQALAMVRLGAYDVLLSPFRDEEVALRACRAIERRLVLGEVVDLRTQLGGRSSYHGMVGGSAQMQAVFELIEQVAGSDASVIVLGETGTGKELVARVLHTASARRHGPFVAINCAAIPEQLFEAELFGHERGAFTGAVARRIGHFERASGGTLFLDEVGDIPPPVQVKLLRVLQERELQRVGGTTAINVDVRLVAATSVDLEQAVRSGRFRADLYYRLNVVPIHVPALRQRRQDIALLAGHFLEQCARRMGKRDITLSPEALAVLEEWPWPGNVRELANVIERAVALARSGGVVAASQLGALAPPAGTEADHPAVASGRPSLKDAVERLERSMIVAALREHAGNISRAAAQLGITRQGLSQKMAKYKIPALAVARSATATQAE